MEFIEKIKQNARRLGKRVVLPEGMETRTLHAADIAIAEGLAEIVLLGNVGGIRNEIDRLGLKHLDQVQILDPSADFPEKESYLDLMVEMRKSKGLTREEAARMIQDPLVLAAVMLKAGSVDGEVAGAENSTGDVLRPAFQFVKTLPGISVVSSSFFMVVPDPSFGENGVIVFSDCAINPNPNERELAEIAVAAARNARAIGNFEPRVAMLSFSTKGSAEHELVTKVRNATRIAREMAPELKIDGEMQADAALVAAIGQKKAPGSEIAGKANVLVFPDLQSGNIGYKLVQRLAGAEAIGPVSQGMARPINDLSRGCSINDIVLQIAITACQADGL